MIARISKALGMAALLAGLVFVPGTIPLAIVVQAIRRAWRRA